MQTSKNQPIIKTTPDNQQHPMYCSVRLGGGGFRATLRPGGTEVIRV